MFPSTDRDDEIWTEEDQIKYEDMKEDEILEKRRGL